MICDICGRPTIKTRNRKHCHECSKKTVKAMKKKWQLKNLLYHRNYNKKWRLELKELEKKLTPIKY